MAERDKNGKFAKGNKVSVGHGRPLRRTEDRYMAVVIGAVSLEDWQAIVTRAVEDAKGGDVQARKWLTSLVIGDKPSIVNVLANIEQDVDLVDKEVRHREKWKILEL
jgi:hypothetical protein